MRFSVALLLVGLVAGVAAADDLGKLKERLAQETDPAKRAKITVKIGEELLKQAAHKYKEEAYSDGDQLLTEYLQAIRAAHEGLQRSGRDARRSPGGFKQLEIHLREGRRKLEDIARQLPYGTRTAVEQALAEVETLRRELLAALMKEHKKRPSADTPEEPPK